MALSTAPTGEVLEVLEAAEVSELVLGVTASLHHGEGTLMGSPDSIPGRGTTAEAETMI